jgi:hypothetical protein
VTAGPEAIQTPDRGRSTSAALAGADAPIESPLLQDMVSELIGSPPTEASSPGRTGRPRRCSR